MEEQEAPVPTGHAEVDAVLAELDALAGLPVADHVPALDAAHARLRALLSFA